MKKRKSRTVLIISCETKQTFDSEQVQLVVGFFTKSFKKGSNIIYNRSKRTSEDRSAARSNKARFSLTAKSKIYCKQYLQSNDKNDKRKRDYMHMSIISRSVVRKKKKTPLFNEDLV